MLINKWILNKLNIIPIRNKNKILYNIQHSILLSNYSKHLNNHLNDSNYLNEKHTWAEKYAPKKLLPYIQLARLNRPAGIYMLLWPSYWSIGFGCTKDTLLLPETLKYFVLFGIGSIIMRSAGCTINDMWDKNYDKKVERTNKRPLACNVLNYKEATGFLALQLSMGLGILLQLNPYCILLGTSSLGFVIFYPFMKRITYWPQAFLGITFNWGILLGYTAITGIPNWSIILPLYLSGITWTIVYDTLYAHQDKEDDIKIGVKSTALLFGDQYTKSILYTFALISLGSLYTTGYYCNDVSFLPYSIGITVSGLQLLKQIKNVDLNNPDSLNTSFISNKYYGGSVFISILAGKIL